MGVGLVSECSSCCSTAWSYVQLRYIEKHVPELNTIQSCAAAAAAVRNYIHPSGHLLISMWQ
jgi:hypothetical protein